MDIQIYNTMTRRKEVFHPIEPRKVRMYNCGPTVYDQAHIGNMRTYIMADLIRRTFEYLGYEVRQVMNVTDVGHLTSDALRETILQRGYEVEDTPSGTRWRRRTLGGAHGQTT